MVRRLLLVLGSVALGSGQMCAPVSTPLNWGDPNPSAAPQNAAANCSRLWRNEYYGFGVNPPALTEGPFDNPADRTNLLWAEWQEQNGRTYFTTVSGVPGYTFPDAVQAYRGQLQQAGGMIIEDRAFVFANGQPGWQFTTVWPKGTTIDVLSFRDEYLFDAGVFDIAGATYTDWTRIDSFVSSLCIDP